ncbi:hypothetical protein, partial [Streptococcus pneumoniae]|uniref:hypothetical protein n=1 Tax=Streptococcus pneumoniae TaxID=1313 RepID=UPI001E412241
GRTRRARYRASQRGNAAVGGGIVTATDEHDGYTTRGVCIPPDMSASFRVLHDEWNDDYTVRTVYDWEPT